MEQTIDLILPTSRDSQFKTSSYQSGNLLVRAGQPLLGIVTVVRGHLKRKRPYPTGEFLVGIAGPGDRIGYFEVFSGQGHLETLEAIGDTEVKIESAAAFERRVRALPLETQKLLKELALASGGLLTKGVGSGQLKRPIDLMPVKARVAATLWQLMAAHGRPSPNGVVLDLELTREEIAHLAGTVYESVIRMLTKFKKEGLIELDGRKIVIKNETLLARTGQVVVSPTESQPGAPLDTSIGESSGTEFLTGVDRHDSRSDQKAFIQDHRAKNNCGSKEAS